MYKRKTYDVWEIQGYYTPTYGWECVTWETSRKDALTQVKLYRQEEPMYSFRIKKKRVPLQDGA